MTRSPSSFTMLLSRHTRRRAFIAGLGGAAVWPLVARAQQAVKPVIGYLSSGTPDGFRIYLDTFLKGLSETGYDEGRNVLIEYRWAEGRYDRLPALAADLVSRQVAVIAATGGNPPAQAAEAATTTIPIVFVSGGDPVSGKLVSSLNRPGGNVTGVSWFATALVPKQLELLRQLTRNSAMVGALVNPDYQDHDVQLRELQEAGNATGQKINIVRASNAHDIDIAFTSLVQQGVGALIVANDPLFTSRRDQIVGLAAHHAIPSIYFLHEFTEAGGLLSYGASLLEATRQGGVYTGKILKGAKPVDLPVWRPTKFDLVINLKTAKSLDLEVPPQLLARADEVIE
jgi:putative tryptophan/tyrosine transport system substrate-binding protein